MITSIKNTPHYTWGNTCEDLHLLQLSILSLVQEHIPPGIMEQNQYDNQTRQLFYILSRKVTFEFNGQKIELFPQESTPVKSGMPHKTPNLTDVPLSFVVISEPLVHTDRIKV